MTGNVDERIVIVLDSREAFVKTELEKLQTEGKLSSADWCIEQLPVGDVAFRKGTEVVALMERKTTSDLYSSIVSKRFAEQRERLKQANCLIVYILEAYGSGLSRLMKGHPMKSVSGAVENLILYDGFHTLPTTGVAHTASTIVSMQKKLTKHPELYHRGNTNQAQVLLRRKDKVMDNMFKHQLLLIPGVSDRIADCIVGRYPSMNVLMEAYTTAPSEAGTLLTELMIGKRRLGPALSAKIHQVFVGGVNSSTT